MGNWITNFIGGGNRNNQLSANDGGGGPLVSSADISAVTSQNLLKNYNKGLNPGGQIPDYEVPKITKPELATQQQALEAEIAADIFADGVKNAQTVYKAAGKIEKESAKLVAAHGGYIEDQLDAEQAKLAANAKLGKKFLSHGLGIQNEAASLDNAIQRTKVQMRQVVQVYKAKGGWT